jgi:hypothetical protein
MASHILCNRHNTSLSKLDSIAGEFFAAMRDDGLSLSEHPAEGEFPCAFNLVSGPMFELWLLKVMWGALAAKTISIDGAPAYRFRLGVATDQLAEILWRGGEWPRRWGLYVPTDTPNGPTYMKSTAIRLVNHGSEILGGATTFAGFEFFLAFDPPDGPSVYRPGAMTFQRRGYRNWKMMAMCWPEMDINRLTR